MKGLRHNTARFQVKAAEQRQFTGLASTWDLDQGGDIIEKGAYARTIGEWVASGRVIPLINQHQYGDARHAIGKMVAAEETDAGLLATFQVVNSPEGDEFLARIKDGIIDGLSIGYETRGWRPPTEAERSVGVQRVLHDVELREVSLVIWGMNQHALIDTGSVKSIAACLATLKRDDLTDEDRKAIRQVASLAGALLRPDSPPDGSSTSTPPADASAGDGQAPPPDVPPAPPAADAPKAYPAVESLGQRLLAARIAGAVTTARITIGVLS